MGSVFLMYDVEENFGVYSSQPFFQSTTDWSTIESKAVYRFDQIMFYAARISGAVHMAFILTLLFAQKFPAISNSFLLTAGTTILPLDVFPAFMDRNTKKDGDLTMKQPQNKMFITLLVLYSKS